MDFDFFIVIPYFPRDLQKWFMSPTRINCMRLIGLSPLAKQEPSGPTISDWIILELPLTLTSAKSN